MGLVNTSEMKRLCHTVYLTDEDIDLIKETFEINVRSMKNKRKKEKIHALFMYLAATKILSLDMKKVIK